MMAQEIILLRRDCDAYLIPSGARTQLPKGTEVMITQALGGTFTVSVYGNLMRIDGKDADALGKTSISPLAELGSDATVLDKVWALLKTCYDPEIPVNIVDLGLIYGCQLEAITDEQQRVLIKMTLTAPGCGMGPVLAGDVKQKMLTIPEIATAEVEITFDPPWNQSRMSDAAKLQLGLL